MSLDVYLTRKKWISYDEGKTLKEENEEVYSANITHNLGTMAHAVKCGEHNLYEYLWRPEEIGIKKASELIEPLKEGSLELKDKPEAYRKYNSSNGWDVYEDFVPFVEQYLAACEANPDTDINVSR